MSYQAEYIWIDGTKPTPLMRCKTRVVAAGKKPGEWGFDGYVVSDCGALDDIHVHHKVTGNLAESAALAVLNSCDLCCGGTAGLGNRGFVDFHAQAPAAGDAF